MAGMSPESVYDGICARLEKYLEKSGISPSRYAFHQGRSESYPISAFFAYTFSGRYETRTVAGGRAAANNYTASDYVTERDRLLAYANNPQQEKMTFLQNRLEHPVRSLCEQETTTIWQSDTFSYRYDCNVCNGSGRTRCHSCGGSGHNRCYTCGGSGTRTETESYTDASGYSHTRSVSRSCYSCGGSGRTTCSGCGGSGWLTCHNCSGHGFFSEYCDVYSEAKTDTSFSARQDGFYREQIFGYLTKSPNRFFVDHFSPQLESHDWDDHGRYVLNFSGLAQVVEANITLGQAPASTYTEVGVNTVSAMLFPPLFDELLSPVVSPYIYKKHGIARFLRKMSPLHFSRDKVSYRKLKSDPTLNSAFLAYSSAGDADKQSKAQVIAQTVKEQTGGFVSSQMSGNIGDMVTRIMSGAAPHTTRSIWFLTTLLVVCVEIVTAFQLFRSILSPTAEKNGLLTGPVPEIIFVVLLFYMAMFYVLSLGLVAPLASFLNSLITRLRQIGIDREHRPRPNNRKHLRPLFHWVWATFALCLGAFWLNQENPNFRAWWQNFLHKWGLSPYLSASNRFSWSDPFGQGFWHATAMTISTRIREFTAHGMPSFLSSFGLPRNDIGEMFKVLLIVVAILIFFFPTLVAIIRRRNWRRFLLGNLFFAPLSGVPWFILLYFSLKG